MTRTPQPVYVSSYCLGAREVKYQKGCTEYPRNPEYLGLIVRIWAGLGLNSQNFTIFYLIWVIMHYCDFGQSKSGVDKLIQYAPEYLVGGKMGMFSTSSGCCYKTMLLRHFTVIIHV